MAEEVIPDDLDTTDESIAERRNEKAGYTPEDMTSWQRPITATIDIINEWAGRIICLLLIPLIFGIHQRRQQGHDSSLEGIVIGSGKMQ